MKALPEMEFRHPDFIERRGNNIQEHIENMFQETSKNGEITKEQFKKVLDDLEIETKGQ